MLGAVGSIRDEIRQTRPFRSQAEEAVVTLVATAARVQEALADVVSGHGITVQQYNVLRILRGAGEAGLPTLDIAARMIDRSPGITRLLDRLERHRLVRRRRCRSDRRQVLCFPTAEGLRILDELERPMADAARRCTAALAATAVDELIRTLDEVRGAASRLSRPALSITGESHS
jgi:DNA-binding MarR family transcriptional regulator